ncbi:MAG: hypothetical protein B9S38_02380 [Verrucomicrobiia bacterium Tous-C4TDCM]|nr:MAG: hypothetical protein B9S38_02380 [Verrucomicrobiae bacterium Tous-C4TDCM]
MSTATENASAPATPDYGDPSTPVPAHVHVEPPATEQERSKGPEPKPMGSLMAEIAAKWKLAGELAPPGTGKKFDIEEYVREQRMAIFKELCPAEFRAPIDRTLLPNLKAWDEADAWSGTHPGLWLWSHGTGRGKTRMAWRLLGRLHVRHGRQIVKASGQQLAEKYFEHHMDGDPRGFYRWLLRFDTILIDDLDKVDLRDRRYVRMIRELFDELYARRKPVVVTSNEPIAFFRKIAGESCARRMHEVCNEIPF